LDFIKRFAEDMAVDGEPAHADWHEGGYLFIVPPNGMDVLRANHAVQCAQGVKADLLDADQLKARFPSMNVADIAGGVHTPEDGWCDPLGLLQGFQRKARSLGVDYVEDRVVAIDHDGKAVRAVRLASRRVIATDHVVNATGAWAKEIAGMVGMPLPIEPLRRFEHYFETPNRIESLPYLKDVERLAFRPEGRGYSGGLVNSDESRGYNFEVDHDYFERVVWPALAHRFPAFEACRCVRTWAGLYEQNELDGNPIIGNWRGRLDNFFVVAGFSGHGMMHAPAAGRAIAELIVYGRFQTIDLSRLGYGRVMDNLPYPERGIL
ncbi:MAG TPA: FAD-dependent oxidoreductase, partial [Burkholderiales bacterium]|nr:FAD-dependent oxidoreductase [Burkholderiales bacterium]